MKALLGAATLCLLATGCIPEERSTDAGADAATDAGDHTDAGPGEKRVGPTGGTASSEDGKATLTIPEGALDKEEAITITRSSAQGTFGSEVYDFGPSPMTFQKDVEICLEPASGTDTSSACLGYLGEGGKWVCEDACLKKSGETLCGQTNHFTSFAILLSGGNGVDNDCDDALFGPAGGTLTSPDSKASLSVPEDALKKSVRITVTKTGETSGNHGSASYALTPDGQVFSKDVQVCLVPEAGTSSGKECLGYQTQDGKWVCEDVCLSRSADRGLCGSTSHFTNFAVLLSGGKGASNDCDDALFVTSGGTLTSPDKAAVLTAPEGALAQPVRITVSKSSVTSGEHGSATYDFAPDGQTFAKNVEVCLLPIAGVSSDVRCLGYLDMGGKWQCEDRCPKSKGSLLCGETDHFTSFAILLKGGMGSACP